MSTRGDTRDLIMKSAGALLQTRGFNGFSYAHIAEELGIKSAAIHYHFPSKSDLGVALVRQYRERYQRWMEEAESRALSPWKKLEGYFGIFEHFLKDGRKSCPAGALQAEFDAISEEMQHEVRLMVRVVHEWLTRVLEDGRTRGEFRFQGAAADKAILIGSTLQGALQMSRAMGREAFDAALRQVRSELQP